MKGLISGKVELKIKGVVAILCHVHLKKSILHIKTAIVRIFILFSGRVYIIGWLLQIAVVLRFILIFLVFCGLAGEIH